MTLLKNFSNQKTLYQQGIFWMVLTCLISNLNDVLVKFLGQRLPSLEISFLRFFFSTCVLIPFVVKEGVRSLHSFYPRYQFLRSLFLFIAISMWCHGVCHLPLTTATTLSFTVPLFVLPLAYVFLKEHVRWQRWLATLFGFFGIVVSVHPSGSFFNDQVLALLISAVMFASLDVINKKILVKESMVSMLFYSALGTTLLSFPFVIPHWIWPSSEEFMFLFLLGGGANLLLFCLLKAFSLSEVSALAPFKYVELLISCFIGFFFFHEKPSWGLLMGAMIIIGSTLYLVYSESKSSS